MDSMHCEYSVDDWIPVCQYWVDMVSIKNNSQRPPRKYTKRQRAAQEAATRRRITEAVVELHRTVGPARTTVKEVAQRAGVGRQTVYNHFATEADLIEACSNHWLSENPLPKVETWAGISDPGRRLQQVLSDLYAWYDNTQDMMGNVLRDAPVVPPLGEVMAAGWFAWLDGVVALLAGGQEASRQVRAAARLAVDFFTWRTLRDAGLSSAEAAKLAAGVVTSAH